MILASSYPYTGNGLGGLPDAIEATVTHEINGQYEFFMRYPVTGLHYEDLISGRIIMAAPDDLTDEQPFRIYRITKPLNGIVSVYARHLCYDMQGIIVEPFTAGSMTEAFQTIPTVCTPSSPITMSTTRTVASGITLEEPRPLWKLLGGQAGSLLDVYGGEWEFDKDEAKLVTHLGMDRGVSIRYGKNMTEMEQDATIESSYSGVYPYWYDEDSNTLVTLTEKYVTVAGSVVSDRVMILDCSSDFDDVPTEAQLRTRAQNYITNNSVGNVKASWKISFVDTTEGLDRIMLGDTLHVYYERLDVNATARAVKTEYDVLQGRYKSITVGRVKQNLASIIVENQEKTEEGFKEIKSDLETAVDDATDFIKHGAGYMRFIYNSSDELTEIVSLDDPDITQASSVWRWNNGGFGHSSTGYNGTYSLAITQNGAIVADFITAGTLNANVIRAGILQDALGKNSWNLDTGAFTITNGSINIVTNSSTNDYIILQYDNGSNIHVNSSVSAGGFAVRDYNNAQDRWFHMNQWGYYEYQDNADDTVSYPISVLANARLTLGSSASAVADGVDVEGDIFLYSSGVLRQKLTGAGKLWQYDANGTERTFIQSDGTITLSDSSGTLRHKLDSNGKLWQYDANGKQRTYLEYGDIMLYTSAEKQTAKLSGSTFAGGGSLQLYDTTATERARMLTDGLYFYDSGGTSISTYDATYYESGEMYSVGTSWTLVRTLTVDPGLYAISAGLAYSNSQPRGVAIVASTGGGGATDYNLAVNENYASVSGRTVSWLWCGTTVRITGTTAWDLKMYAKSANAGNNRVYMFAKRIG